MNSRATITAVGDSLDSYLDSNYTGEVPIMDTEYDFRTLDSLASDKSIPGLRIGLFEQPEDALIRVGAGNLFDANQAYLMQLFFVVARVRDYDTNVELEMLDIKDLIDDWAYTTDFSSVTSQELMTFGWDAINRIDRQSDYSLLEINFGAFRQRRL